MNDKQLKEVKERLTLILAKMKESVLKIQALEDTQKLRKHQSLH